MNVSELLHIIRELAPERLASPWDNSGVQIAGDEGRVRKVAVSLEPGPEVLARCLDWGARMAVSHHPLYFKPQAPTTPGPYLDALRLLLTKNIWLYSAHTSLDANPAGPARWLGHELKLSGRSVLEPAADGTLLAVSLAADIPAKGLESWPGVRAAVHAGDELRLYCEESAWPALAERLRTLAPGVEPFAAALRNKGPEAGFGEIGDLPRAVGLETFLKKLSALTGRKRMALCGREPGRIRRVAYCPGSGSSLLALAFARGADVFVTGDMKYHAALSAPGLVVDVGHFCLEEEMMRRFAARLAERAEGVSVRFFEGSDPFRSWGA